MPDTYLIQCSSCGTEHRVPHGNTREWHRCPRCGAPIIASHTQPIPVTDVEWDAEMGGCAAPAVVVVASQACGTCAQYEASVRLMAAHLYGSARVLWMDIDRSPQTATRYQVRGVPTVLLFRDGELQASLPGPRGEQGLRERLGID
ncbi:MAG TPA: thioredoxin domain-containing protein [Deferrisomatales bacterium]|nr:thioredoxin domain-containing protein [Deferrisomatales bacterium]